MHPRHVSSPLNTVLKGAGGWGQDRWAGQVGQDRWGRLVGADRWAGQGAEVCKACTCLQPSRSRAGSSQEPRVDKAWQMQPCPPDPLWPD